MERAQDAIYRFRSTSDALAPVITGGGAYLVPVTLKERCIGEGGPETDVPVRASVLMLQRGDLAQAAEVALGRTGL